MGLGTKCARNSCAGIGPLQLGVVLVCTIIDLISTQNVRSEELVTFFEFMKSSGDVVTMHR